ncbi:hypothetical protein GOODEAATRI_031473 [Goodea atripinnis]|uniref:Uncharacterized protein n=1 Tax=Goodea atripinnis TaxID=208336 RepID=A0ABV0MWP5_9TELE
MGLVMDIKSLKCVLNQPFQCMENSLQIEDIQNNCHCAQVWPSKLVHKESRLQDANSQQNISKIPRMSLMVMLVLLKSKRNFKTSNFHGSCARRNFLSSKRNMKDQLVQREGRQNEGFWNNVL